MIVYVLTSYETQYEDPPECLVLGVFKSLERAKAEIDAMGWEKEADEWVNYTARQHWTINEMEVIEDGK